MNVEIAERLASRRKEAGLSQEALAEKLGVSRQAVSKWERSESSPDTDNLILLAKLYGVSLDDLLYVDARIEDDIAFETADRAQQRKAGEAQGVNRAGKVDEEKGGGEVGGVREAGEATIPTDIPIGHEDSTESAASTDPKGRKGSDYVKVGFGGIHVEDGDDSVHVSWRDGVHVSKASTGEEVHVGWDGIHADVRDGIHEGRGRNRRRREGWYEGRSGSHEGWWNEDWRKEDWPMKKAWLKFPFPLLAVIAYLLLGFYADAWGASVLVFLSIPVYYMVGHAIDRKSFAPLLAGLYPLVATIWFLWMTYWMNSPHPAWMIFLTIPIVEWVIHTILKSRWRKRRREEAPVEAYAEVPVEAYAEVKAEAPVEAHATSASVSNPEKS